MGRIFLGRWDAVVGLKDRSYPILRARTTATANGRAPIKTLRRPPCQLSVDSSGAQGSYRVLNRPGFTGGQNSWRIARYGTDTEEEYLEAVFTRVPRRRGAAGHGTPRRVSERSCGAGCDRRQTWLFARQPSCVGPAGSSAMAASGLGRRLPRRRGSRNLSVRTANCVKPMRL